MIIDRTRLPIPGPPRPFHFPAIEKSTLANGLSVWTVPRTEVPLIALTLLIKRGASDDPPGKEGLAALTLDMLDEGSGERSAIEMHEALARLGAQLDTDVGSDAAAVSLTILARHTAPSLALMADIVARPALREADFARVRQLRLHRLTQLRDIPSAVADRALVKLLYGEHPYGHTPIGTEHALAGMSPDDVRAFHRRVIHPSSTTLIAVGDCEHADIHRFAADAFGSWTGQGPNDAASSWTLPRAAPINVIPRAAAPQSELRIGHVAVARSTPDYHALVVANMVLGGQFVSRINLNLREHKGFTYGARTAFDFRRQPGPFMLQVSVQTSATAEAIRESIAEIDSIRERRPVTADELALAVAALTRGYARNFETGEHIARAIAQLVLYDLPDNYFAEFVPRVTGVTIEEITEAVTRHVDPSRLTTVVVGDLDVIGADLGRLGSGEPVVLGAEGF
jgi:predicted Zn-dependent peptidase